MGFFETFSHSVLAVVTSLGTVPSPFQSFFSLPYDGLSSVCIDIAWKNFSVSALLVLKLSFGCPEFNSAVRNQSFYKFELKPCMNEIIFFFYFTLQPPLTLVICNLVKHFQAQIKECCAKLQRFVPVLICSMAYSMYDVPIKDNTSRFAGGNLES